MISTRMTSTRMIPTRTPRPQTARPAFTLVELLVVIGIIIILMGILLPVVTRMRRAANAADTSNEISQLSNACNQYYTTFNAYPGPFSNDYIEGTTATVPGTPTALAKHKLEIYNPTVTSNWVPYAGTYVLTGSENLVLGLMGGLHLEPTIQDRFNPPNLQPAFAASEVGQGQANLNPQQPGRSPPFFPNGSNYLMWCQQSASGPPLQSTTYQASLTPIQFTDAAGNQSQDSPIPEFVDRFPTPGPMPILYVRARTGAKGVLSDGVIFDAINPAVLAQYQYDIREVAAYTQPNPANLTISNASIGLPLPSGSQTYAHNFAYLPATSGMGPTTVPRQGVTNTGAPIASSGSPKIGTTTNLPDAFNYFVNSSTTPTNQTSPAFCNDSGRPRAVDQFILISAGPDGIYGTADDITSFGDVTQ